MKKLLFSLGMLYCVSSFAQDDIVYIVPQKIFESSKILTTLLTQQQSRFEAQKKTITTKMDQLDKQFDQKNVPAEKLTEISAQLNTLQNEYSMLTKNSSTEYDGIKNDYMQYVRKATNELYQTHKYKYILNSAAIVVTNPDNDISTLVSNEADKLYTQAHQK